MLKKRLKLLYSACGSGDAAAPPLCQDSVRAWLVLLSAFVASMLTLGNALTLGVMFNPIQALFPEAHVSSINMVFALTAALTYMAGTLASVITANIGYRLSMLFGALLASLGFLCAAFATKLWHLYLTIGCTTGIGFGLIFTPAIGVIPYYFDRHRQFAVTTATMGVGVGVIAYSRIHNWLLSSLEWRYAMYVEAILTLALLYCGVIVRDPPQTHSQTLAVAHHPSTHQELEGSKKQEPKSDVYAAGTTDEGYHTPDSEENEQEQQLNIVVAADSVAVSAPASVIGAQDVQRDAEEAVAGIRTISLMTSGVIEDQNNTTLQSSYHRNRRRVTHLYGFHLFSSIKFYFILAQGLTLMCSSLFLITTTPFLTDTQHWSASHAASALTVFGIAALIMRISICIFNAFPRCAKRVCAATPIAIGNVLIFSTACVYFFTSHHKMSTIEENLSIDLFGSHNGTSKFSQKTKLFDEHNAILLLIFAACNGAGHAIFLAYQPALVVEMLGASSLTAGFGYLNFVWGCATLFLYPAAGWIADLFGGMRYAYILGVACCAFSFACLLLAALFHRRDTVRAANKKMGFVLTSRRDSSHKLNQES